MKRMLSVILCGLAMQCCAETNLDDLKKDFQKLNAQFEQTKNAYEQRISELERKIRELESNPAAGNQAAESAGSVPVDVPRIAAPETGQRPSGAQYLPDISVIGDVHGDFGKSWPGDKNRNKIFLQELELGLQGYLFPNVRADAFVSWHRHEDGEYAAELEEGYISFLNLGHGFAALAGKKLLPFGKVNPVHPHHWDFVDRPLVLKEYLGDHGCAGNGVNVSYLFPLPFFLQGEVGYWDVAAEHEHGDIPTVSPAGDTYTARLWTSVPLKEKQELEVGFSGLMGDGSHHEEHYDRMRLYGCDLTYKYFGQGYQRLLFRNELMYVNREIPLGTQEKWGLYSFLNWRWDKNWDVGMRYDWVQPPFPGDLRADEQEASLILTRSLTEMTKLRLQAHHNLKDDYGIYFQVVFGIGPHSHAIE